jgi:hypothetical protein
VLPQLTAGSSRDDASWRGCRSRARSTAAAPSCARAQAAVSHPRAVPSRPGRNGEHSRVTIASLTGAVFRATLTLPVAMRETPEQAERRDANRSHDLLAEPCDGDSHRAAHPARERLSLAGADRPGARRSHLGRGTRGLDTQ